MDNDDRRIVESPLYQGEEEVIYYQLTTTPWGSSPTSVAVKIYDIANDYNDVTSTNLSGAASVNGDVITFPAVTGLTDGRWYRLECKFSIGSNTFESWIDIRGQR